MNLNLNGTSVFEKNYSEYTKNTRLIVNQGGRGSSKTWSIAQLFLLMLVSQKNILLTVARKTLPALKATAMRDFLEIMKQEGLYREENHNKSDHTYKYRNNEIEFISIDQPQKVRGRKRHYLWLNEANEFAFEDFRQLNMRTEKQIYMDFNPSDEYHWIYDHVLTRDDAVLIKSTYLDNPFLDTSIVKEIERLRALDPNYWRIYGLGERGISEMKIYSHWQYCDKLPNNPDEIIYGLDFGYNNATALVKVVIRDQNIFTQELIYKSYLTNAQLIEEIKIHIKGSDIIYADCAEPQRIEEIRKAGFNIKPADKEVEKGIDAIKTRNWYITKDSVNTLKEVKSYSWKEKDGKALDEPVKVNDHLMDAIRYAVHTHFLKPKVMLYV
jgi:phage terminase large subunit